MFGQNDNQQQDQNQHGAPMVDPAAAPQPPSVPAFTPPPSNVTAPAAPAQAEELQLPGSSSLQSELTQVATNPPATDTGTQDQPAGLTASPNDLIRIKQDALQQLSPLVDHLEQTPEERFRTTMMMIQATDDSSKIKEAYEAAQQITDEKVRAQALLDVVNEINYFSQQLNSQDKPDPIN